MGAVVGTIGIVVRTSKLLDTALLDTVLHDPVLLDTAPLDTALLDTALLDTALLAMESSPRLVLQDQPVDRVPTRKLRCGWEAQSEAIRADRSLLNS